MSRNVKLTKPKRGFTLMEVLVALGIFGMGVIALIHIQRESVVASSTLRERLIADMVAENVLAETLMQLTLQPVARMTGTVDMAGQTWRWRRELDATSSPAIQTVSVSVQVDGQSQVLSTVTGFQGLAP